MEDPDSINLLHKISVATVLTSSRCSKASINISLLLYKASHHNHNHSHHSRDSFTKLISSEVRHRQWERNSILNNSTPDMLDHHLVTMAM